VSPSSTARELASQRPCRPCANSSPSRRPRSSNRHRARIRQPTKKETRPLARDRSSKASSAREEQWRRLQRTCRGLNPARGPERSNRTVTRESLRTVEADARIRRALRQIDAGIEILQTNQRGELVSLSRYDQRQRARLFQILRQPDENGRVWSLPAIAAACGLNCHTTIIKALASLERPAKALSPAHRRRR
jgi:hypothetical protein